MAVRIRLSRVGATKQPTYRFVVTDSRNARDGRSIETLGHYNPRTDPIEINLNEERAKEWMSRGAKPSDTVDRLFRRMGVLPERTDRPTGPARGPKKADKTTKAAKRAAAAQAAAEAPPEPAEAEAAAPEAEAAAPEAEVPAEEAVAEEAATADAPAEEPTSTDEVTPEESATADEADDSAETADTAETSEEGA